MSCTSLQGIPLDVFQRYAPARTHELGNKALRVSASVAPKVTVVTGHGRYQGVPHGLAWVVPPRLRLPRALVVSWSRELLSSH